MTHSTHAFDQDPRNESIQIDINGALFPRNEAKISVFDAGFVLGDGVWEGLRVHSGPDGQGVIVFLKEHLRRLYEGAKTLCIDMPLTANELARRLYECLDANNAHDGVHIRLMVTRGPKSTPYQDPRASAGPPTVVIIPEFKSAKEQTAQQGVHLYTVHVRRGYPDVQDQKLNSHSKLNCILACIAAEKAGADEALMLDPHGFVATCNSTHFFIVRDGEIWTSTGDFCLGGITRGKIIDLGQSLGMTVRQRNFSLHDTYNAEEAFVTGTFAGVTPVTSIDGREISPGRGQVVERLQKAYGQLIQEACSKGRQASW
ncbi:MAG: aminotransferase class IV [Pseudomonadota bacterium]